MILRFRTVQTEPIYKFILKIRFIQLQVRSENPRTSQNLAFLLRLPPRRRGGGGDDDDEMMLRRCCAKAVRSFSSSSSSSSPSTHFHTIQAVPREVVGPRAAAKERSHGRIPSVVFARGEAGGDGARPVSRKQLLTTERKQIHSLLKAISHESFCCTAFQLQIRAGAGSSCLLDSGWVLPIKVLPFFTCTFVLVGSWFDSWVAEVFVSL